MNLTHEQTAAVLATEPRVLVEAGAGAGKTTVMVHRVVALMRQGVPRRRILVCTFTRYAAGELLARLKAELGPATPEVTTLHSWCVRFLRRYHRTLGLPRGFAIYDEVVTDGLFKRHGWVPGKNDGDYAKACHRAAAVDLAAVEEKVLDVLRKNPAARAEWSEHYRHVLVDEYQDTSLVQAAVLAGLAPRNVFLCGDPRQVIYSWRNATADLDGLDGYTRYPLTQSRRCGRQVTELANHVAAPLAATPMRWAEHIDKAAVVRVEDQMLCMVDTLETVTSTGQRPWSSAVVLARTWRTLQRAADALTDAGIPHRVCGRRQDWWYSASGRELLLWSRWVANPYDDNVTALLFQATPEQVAAAQRKRLPLCETLPLDGVPAPTDPLNDAMQRLSDQGHITPLLPEDLDVPEDLTLAGVADWHLNRSVQDRLPPDGENAVSLLTIHGAKGLEWDHVVLLDAVDGTFPGHSQQANVEEDRRLLYVASTRARRTLTAFAPFRVTTSWGRVRDARPSPFFPPHPEVIRG